MLNEDGSLAAGCGHHTHSYLNTLRGLLGLAVLQGSRRRQELICLIELWTRTVDVEEEIVRVNFHFDRKLPQVEVSAERGESTARVAVVNRTGKELRLRLPGWADPGTCSLTVDESPVEATVENGFVVVGQRETATTSELCFALPEYEEEELSRDESAVEEAVTFRWRGDEIAGVSGGLYMAQWPALWGSLL